MISILRRAALPVLFALSGASVAHAQSAPALPPGLAQLICAGSPEWQKQAREYLQASYPDRQATAQRAWTLVENFKDVAAKTKTGCGNRGPELVDLVKDELCAAYQVGTVCVRRFFVQKGVQAFDFQPAGGKVYPGFTPIAPGDPRVDGGTGVSYNEGYRATGDAMVGVKSFSTPLADGHWRIVMIAGKRPQKDAIALPFGSYFKVNGRRILIAGGRVSDWLPQGALGNGTPEEVFRPDQVLPGISPGTVFDTHVTGGKLTLEFPEGAEIAALLIEPPSLPSSLVVTGVARQSAFAAVEDCLVEQEKIDKQVARAPGFTPFTPPPPPAPPGATPPGPGPFPPPPPPPPGPVSQP